MDVAVVNNNFHPCLFFARAASLQFKVVQYLAKSLLGLSVQLVKKCSLGS